MKKILILLLLLSIGTYFRFYNLNWGSPFYFHPDERNITSLALTISLIQPLSLLKGTFSYGNFPLIIEQILQIFLIPVLKYIHVFDPFAQTTIILRSISAFFSVLTCIVIYKTGKFWSERVAWLSFIFSIFSVGFIQQAHFGTFDGFIAFCAITAFYYLLCFLKSQKISFFYLSLIFISFGAAAKITILVLAIFPFISLLLLKKNAKVSWKKILLHSFIGISAVLILTILLSPYYLTRDFKNALIYERQVVTGTLPVFYTQSFSGTTPVIFQFLRIYPFLLNPIFTALFIASFFYLSIITINKRAPQSLFLILMFFIVFLPEAFLFAKWTRYMIPTLPFIYLIISIALDNIGISKIASFILVGLSIIFASSYLITAYVEKDTRVYAAKWASQHIPAQSNILTEIFDLGIVPFNNYFSRITLFNFYDLDGVNTTYPDLSKINTIILPSQRIIKTRLADKIQFVRGNYWYGNLVSGSFEFYKAYQTPCDIWCKITYLGDPVNKFEETTNIFDRPTVYIFLKKS